MGNRRECEVGRGNEVEGYSGMEWRREAEKAWRDRSRG